MVLKRALLVLSLAALACIPKRAPVRAKTPLTVTVAAVFDRADSPDVAAVPEKDQRRIASELNARNLKPHAVPPEQLASAFSARRTTAQRMAALSDQDGELLLLVETGARFYSQMNGRYRWDVDLRVTLARKGALDQASTAQTSFAAFLDFENEREPEALASAAPRIADEVGRITDEFLGGLAAQSHPRWLASNGDVVPIAHVDVKKPPPAESIYFVLVDRFANGDKTNDGAIDPKDPQAFHGGDLQGVLDHIDALKDLGVSTVWLSPVFKMRTEKYHGYGAYHGYWVEDFDQIEPRFGTTALLKKLSDELHARNMKLVLDIVLNHVAPESELPKKKPAWFHHNGAITDWNDPLQLVSREVYGLPDLAQENPEVYSWLLTESLAWIDRVHPDGFRLDAARHIPLEFWKKYDADIHVKAGKEFALYGEMFDGDPATLSRTQHGAGFDGVFDFPLYYAMKDVFCDDAPVSHLAATLFADRQYDDPSRLVTFLDSHDLPRLLSVCHGDEKRIEQALTFLLTARGIPSLTYGTESGLTGQKEPENRADMSFDAKPTRDHIRSLLALRALHPALTEGATTRMLALDDNLFAYARMAPTETFVIAVNRGTDPARLSLPKDLASSDAEDMITRAAVTFPATIGPLSSRIFLLVPAVPAPAAAMRRVRFRVQRELAIGEYASIVGSGKELGDWILQSGIPLSRVKGSKDQLVADVNLPVGGAFEWKVVVEGTDAARWLPATKNLPLLVLPGKGRQDVFHPLPADFRR